MAWIALWPTRITEFLHTVQIIATLEFSAEVEVYFNSLLILLIPQGVEKKPKQQKPRAQNKPKDLQVLKRNNGLAKKLLWLSLQSCVYTRLVESNRVNFAINKTGTDTASWRHKTTRLPAVLLLPSHSIFHLQVCAGSCPQRCCEPRDLLTQHKTKLPSRAGISARDGSMKKLPIFHHQASQLAHIKMPA